MPIQVDTNGNGTFDQDDDGVTALPPLTDETGDGIDDVNLTTALASAIINGAIFQDAANVGSGTGGYNTFLALRDQTGGEVPQDLYEQGFNSNDTNPLDGTNDEIDPSKTQTVLLGAIPIRYINGVAYFEFRVDLNESNSAPDTNISLDQFRLYTSSNGNIQSTTDLFSSSLRYDMDAVHNVSILLSEANSSGSGNDDYSVLVPIANFAGLDPASTYVYLWVQMGNADGPANGLSNSWITDGGFEEWNIQNAVILRGVKFNDIDGDGVQDIGEGGLSGVTIFIDDDLDGVAEATDGNGVIDAGEQSTVTGVNGIFSFGGIPVTGSNYSFMIREVVPAGYVPSNGQTDANGAFWTVSVGANATAGSIITLPSIGNHPLTPSITITKDATIGDECVDTVGETILYTITVDNDGELALNNVVLNDNFEDGGNVVIVVTGDSNNNNILDLGEVWRVGDLGNDGIMGTNETWTYTYLRAATQAQLDSNAGGDGLLTDIASVAASSANGNVSDTDDAAVAVCLDPDFTIDKSIDSIVDGTDFGGTGQIDSAGDQINYRIVITNTGNITLNLQAIADQLEAQGIPVTADSFIESLANNNELEVGETWTWTWTETVSQDELDALCATDEIITNSVTATFVTDGGEVLGPRGDSISTPIVCTPDIDVEKSVRTNLFGFQPEDFDDEPDGLQAGTASRVDFRLVVSNTGNVTLTAVTLVDSVSHTVNGTVTSQTIVYSPDGNAATLDAFDVFIDLNSDGIRAIDGTEDWDNFDTDGDGTIDTGQFAELAPGESFTVYYSLNSALGQHENTATVSGSIGTETTTDSDDANYYVLGSDDCVGVGTPGFWSKNGFAFWNGITGDERHIGNPSVDGDSDPGFADGELLYSVDSNKDGVIDASDAKGLLIGDYNANGITDIGEDTIFVSLADAQKLIAASNRQLNGGQADGIWILGRDTVATWLNYLANGGPDGDCIGESSNSFSPSAYLDNAIDWLQQFASNQNSNAANNLVNSYHDGNTQATFQFDTRISTNSSAWQNAFMPGEDIAFSGSAIHGALDNYNNTGTIWDPTANNGNGGFVEYCCDRDSETALYAMSTIVETVPVQDVIVDKSFAFFG